MISIWVMNMAVLVGLYGIDWEYLNYDDVMWEFIVEEEWKN